MDATYNWLKEITANYKILVDTSALMQQNSDKFFLEVLLPLLKRYDNKLILPWVVVKELEKHKKNPEKAALAIQGLKILLEYEKEELLEKRGEKTDYIPDQVFQVVLTKFKVYHNLAFITNDRNLARDLCIEHNAVSVGTRKSMVIISVRRDGTAFKLAENGTMLERLSPRPKQRHNQRLEFESEDTTHIDNIPVNITTIPKEGDKVYTPSGQQYILLKELAKGGEGTIYLIDNEGMVAKIYHPDKLTVDIYKKIEIMVKNKDKIDVSVSHFSIAWPQEVIYNSKGEFVGYIMPKVNGAPLQKTVFLPMILKKKYPHFQRVHLIRIAINVLEALDYLHSFGILMGDINAMNILIDEKCHVSLIDVDSYQFGPFRCKVGRPEFTHPEKIGMRYDEYFREPKDEMFEMAILVFMTLLPGKHPFAHQGGEGIINNIQQRAFSYRVSTAEGTSYENAPIGPWRFIWSHVPLSLKDLLYKILTGQIEPKSFEELQEMTRKLLRELRRYAHEIESGKRSNEIFPRYYYIPDNIPKVQLRCHKCGHYFEITQEYYESIKHRNEILCPACFKLHQLQINQSRALPPRHYSRSTRHSPSTGATRQRRYSTSPRTLKATSSRGGSKQAVTIKPGLDTPRTAILIIGGVLIFLFLLLISPVLAFLLLLLVLFVIVSIQLSQK